MEYERNWIKVGREVAHKEHLSQKLFVEDFIKKFVERPNSHNPDEKETKMHLMGVKCHWWNKEGELVTAKFHKNELIPWEVAEQGHIAVLEFIENLNSMT